MVSLIEIIVDWIVENYPESTIMVGGNKINIKNYHSTMSANVNNTYYLHIAKGDNYWIMCVVNDGSKIWCNKNQWNPNKLQQSDYLWVEICPSDPQFFDKIRTFF